MIREQDCRNEYILNTAKAMAAAARTAPKARGTDNLIVCICDKDDIEKISSQMKQDYQTTGAEFLLRDANNILFAPYMLLIATKIEVLGLDCAYCGFDTCEQKVKAGKTIPCFFNAEDMGLAIGSAVSTASQRKVDCRVMYSAGNAAAKLGFVGKSRQCLAIPLSVSAKNPFFDR